MPQNFVVVCGNEWAPYRFSELKTGHPRDALSSPSPPCHRKIAREIYRTKKGRGKIVPIIKYPNIQEFCFLIFESLEKKEMKIRSSTKSKKLCTNYSE